jgi:hypothetical protein
VFGLITGLFFDAKLAQPGAPAGKTAKQPVQWCLQQPPQQQQHTESITWRLDAANMGRSSMQNSMLKGAKGASWADTKAAKPLVPADCSTAAAAVNTASNHDHTASCASSAASRACWQHSEAASAEVPAAAAAAAVNTASNHDHTARQSNNQAQPGAPAGRTAKQPAQRCKQQQQQATSITRQLDAANIGRCEAACRTACRKGARGKLG